MFCGGVSQRPAAELQLEVRDPLSRSYWVTIPERAGRQAGLRTYWLLAHRDGSADQMLLGRRVVVQLQPGTSASSVLPSGISRQRFAENLWLLEVADAPAALQLTTQLLPNPAVTTVHPVRRRLHLRQRAYAPPPNDPLFGSIGTWTTGTRQRVCHAELTSMCGLPGP